MVHRCYVEKRPAFAREAAAVYADLKDFLRIASLEKVRLINRYDVENINLELFIACKSTVFSDPSTDEVFEELPAGDYYALAVESLPGMFDQRSDSAEQCIRLISREERCIVRTARVYLLYGALRGEDKAAVKKYIINPVECREAALLPYTTLFDGCAVPRDVPVLSGFKSSDDEELAGILEDYGLAMDINDLKCCRDYFQNERRDPTLTELLVLDAYWSDHCRHTTFRTILDNIEFEHARIQKSYERYLALRREMGIEKPVTLMDMATVAARYFKKRGSLPGLDDSAEVNACTVKINVNIGGNEQPWLLLFKNETHNHPTEIEPFGGAATCIGGAIRDPLSGRGYVYQAMRLSGAADPRRALSETIPGKLPQRKIVTEAAAGYSSYGNQIGLPTGLVDEVYHDGYMAKRMEIGAVIAAAPRKNVRREEPVPGDVIILLGGRTGRDGCGGAAGSSKAHTLLSLEKCGPEVQKGNALEERKLQRLFRSAEFSSLIKRCNDFGAGGVAVAVGEIANGVRIDLDAVPKKYEGLDGTEIAISESQERLAVVVSPEDADKCIELAAAENVQATVIAKVTDRARLEMYWQNRCIVDISREFIDSSGGQRHADARISAPGGFLKTTAVSGFSKNYIALLADLNVCSKRGLCERFDSTVGANTVLMPFGGKRQLTPVQAMAAKIPVQEGETATCSVMSWGFNPFISEASPYHGAYLAVVESVSTLLAAGAAPGDCYLSFQEYFEKPKQDPYRWGKPAAAMLGALQAQLDFKVAAIGGKDSMNGSFEQLDVPPTLVSFAVSTADVRNVLSPEFKRSRSKVVLLSPEYLEDGLPDAGSQREVFDKLHELIVSKSVLSVYTPAYGGVAEAVFKMSIGDGFGFEFDDSVTLQQLFGYSYGSFVLELDKNTDIGVLLGFTTEERVFSWRGEKLDLNEMERVYESVLEGVFPAQTSPAARQAESFEYRIKSHPHSKLSFAQPRVLIPVFPGTNCEYESSRAVESAGGEPLIMVINTMSTGGISESIERFSNLLSASQILFIPGGFSNGDEPDGSGKFIAAFFRNPLVRERIDQLMQQRDGLILGICNGFQALIKLGLVPYGRIVEPGDSVPALTYNTIGRHQSRLVRTRVASNKSPWLMYSNVGEIYTVPVSHGEGRFVCSPALLAELAENGQIITQYVDHDGHPSMDVRFNPSGSTAAVEGIISPDGRVLGKMGHSERIGSFLYKNVDGDYDMRLFKSAFDYFS
ncbi:MAG: Phosphoribosylformylglycinamidine synthase 2 [Firmicutes bacterium ADurb.Bin182]|nr:MAG: Phosphoribosylformylglycinamidine synthase 2 [Firmicutes bacterium ADurb.Bin182]